VSTNPPPAFVWDGESPVPMEHWGRDHWSTLAYIETRCVDHGGWLDGDKMRNNWRLHRQLIGRLQLIGQLDGAKYPTQLKNGQELQRHDDWSCLEDMESAGLLTSDETAAPAGQQFGGARVRVFLTAEGQAIAQRLRLFKQGGGTFAEFTP
jgi:hypothetical protein